MTPRRYFYYLNYPEESKKADQEMAEYGVYVVNSVSHFIRRVILPFFIPPLKKSNNLDKDKDGNR